MDHTSAPWAGPWWLPVPTLIHDSFPITPEDDCFSVQIEKWIVDVFPKKIRKHLQKYFPEFRSCIPEISNPNTQCHLSSPGHHALRSHPRLVADSVSSAPCTGNCCSVRKGRSDATQLCQIHLQKKYLFKPKSTPKSLTIPIQTGPDSLQIPVLAALPAWLPALPAPLPTSLPSVLPAAWLSSPSEVTKPGTLGHPDSCNRSWEVPKRKRMFEVFNERTWKYSQPCHYTIKINKSNQPRENGQRKKVFDTWSISHDEASQSWNPNRCSCCWRCLPPTGRHLKRQQGPVELICAIQTIHPSKHQSVSARVFLWVQHMQTTVSPSTWHAPNAISKPWRKCACPSNSFTSTSHQALCATHNKGMPCFQKISTWKLRNHRDQVTSRQF